MTYPMMINPVMKQRVVSAVSTITSLYVIVIVPKPLPLSSSLSSSLSSAPSSDSSVWSSVESVPFVPFSESQSTVKLKVGLAVLVGGLVEVGLAVIVGLEVVASTRRVFKNQANKSGNLTLTYRN